MIILKKSPATSADASASFEMSGGIVQRLGCQRKMRPFQHGKSVRHRTSAAILVKLENIPGGAGTARYFAMAAEESLVFVVLRVFC